MKNKLWLLLISGLMLLYTPHVYSEQGVARDDYVRISFIEGNGLVHHGFNQNDEQATINTMLMEGDTMETFENSRAEILFSNGIIIRMNGKTKIQLLALKEVSNSAIIVRLIGGDINADSSIASIRENSFRVDTVDCSIYMMQEGYFRVVSDQYTDVMVYRGSIEIATENNTFSLNSGQRLFNVASPESQPEYFNTFAGDNFSQWNESRQGYYGDKRINQEYSSGVNPYDMTELDEYGDWRYESEYGGNVWVPSVSQEWRPYLYGGWSWYPSGWSWVSYEPWGWAPYHYGRWGYGASIGWFWVPRPVFGLGWVSWYSWDDYVGWCPLDYHDRPLFFDHIGNNGYYRPNMKSWTIIPKTRLGYKEAYKYRFEDGEKIKSMVINKNNIQNGTQFNYRPKTLPNYKHDSLKIEDRYGSSPEFKDFPKRSLEKYTKENQNYGTKNRQPEINNDFKRFKENIEKYNPKQLDERGNQKYPENYNKNDQKPDNNPTRSYPKSNTGKTYPQGYPGTEKNYERQNKGTYTNDKRYERDYVKRPYEDYPFPLYNPPSLKSERDYPNSSSGNRSNPENQDRTYKPMTPSYGHEVDKVFERIYRERSGSSSSQPQTEKGSSYKPSTGGSSSGSGSSYKPSSSGGSSYKPSSSGGSSSRSSSSSSRSSGSSSSSSSPGSSTPAKRK